MSSKYSTVSLKKGLFKAVVTFVEGDPRYTSVSDFVHDAVRRRLEELEKLKMVMAQSAQEDEE